MKHLLAYYWHMYRAGYYWSKMTAKQDNTGIDHRLLIEQSNSYRKASACYNQSIDWLANACHYITAKSLIAEVRENNVHTIAKV